MSSVVYMAVAEGMEMRLKFSFDNELDHSGRNGRNKALDKDDEKNQHSSYCCEALTGT